MKKIIILALAAPFILYSCKGEAGKEAEAGTATEKEAVATEEKKTPVYVVNEADWVDTDLSKILPRLPITVKLPKTVVLEKISETGVTAKLNDYYMFVISEMSDLNSVDLVSSEKDTKTTYAEYENVKLLKDEPSGFVYTFKQKEDKYNKEYGYANDPQTHFYYAIQKGKTSYTISDDQSPGYVDQLFTDEAALKAYEIIKNSMKVKE